MQNIFYLNGTKFWLEEKSGGHGWRNANGGSSVVAFLSNADAQQDAINHFRVQIAEENDRLDFEERAYEDQIRSEHDYKIRH